jgi:hypothetical protein
VQDSKVYDKAVKRGDRTFTLVGQDRSAPLVICEWIKANIETAPAGKLFEALEDAIRMRESVIRKVAD